MPLVKTSLYCFKCKNKKDVEFESTLAKKTTNNRYCATVACPECGRSMTSLIKSNLIQLENDGPVESEHLPLTDRE